MFADIWLDNLENKPEEDSVKDLEILINNNKDNDEEDKLAITLLKKNKKVIKKFPIYMINKN